MALKQSDEMARVHSRGRQVQPMLPIYSENYKAGVNDQTLDPIRLTWLNDVGRLQYGALTNMCVTLVPRTKW